MRNVRVQIVFLFSFFSLLVFKGGVESSRAEISLPRVVPSASSIPGIPIIPSRSPGAGPKTLMFRVRDEPETLDWNRAHTVVESYILMNLMEGLVTLDSTLKPTPALAESWSISQDRKTYTFKLRPGVQWSDGVKLRAQDFVFSWKRLLSPMTAASYAYCLFDVEGAEAYNTGKISNFDEVGVKALDDSTLQVKLTQPVAHWIFIPGFWVTFPARKDVIDKYGTGWETPGRMVSLGPYLLQTHDIGSKIVMTANPNYYGTRGNVDQVVALIMQDDAAALSLYQAGKLDFLSDLATIDLSKFSSHSDLKALPLFKTGFLSFVPSRYPASNVKLRRAISMAIDKKGLIQLLQGGHEAATSFVPPMMFAHSSKLGLPYDPVNAKLELKTSGLLASGPITLNYVLPNWDKARVIGAFIKGELKKNLNIEINLQAFDNQVYRNELGFHAAPLFDLTWTADYPDPDNFLSLFLSTSGNSQTTWKNTQYDESVQLARRSESLSEREKIYFDLQKLLLEKEAVIVPLYYEQNLVLVKPWVKNFLLTPMGHLYLRKVNVGPIL